MFRHFIDIHEDQGLASRVVPRRLAGYFVGNGYEANATSTKVPETTSFYRHSL